MKKMRKAGKILMSLFATVAIIMSFVVVPVSAYTETVQSSENLESYATGTTFGGKWEVAEEENGNKYFNSYGDGVTGYYNPAANTGTGGIIKASFDFRFSLTAGRGFVSLYNGSDGPHDKTKMLTLLYKNEGQARCANNGMFNPTINTWYTEEAIIDLDTKKVNVVIYEKSTGNDVAELNKTLTPTSVDHDGWAAGGNNSFQYWLIAANDDGGNGVLDLDNFKVVRYNSGYRYANDYTHGSAPSNGTIATSGSERYVTVDGAWKAVDYSFNSISSDKIRVSFDFMDTVAMAGSSIYYALGNSASIDTRSELLVVLREGTNKQSVDQMECYSSTQNRRILGEQILNTWLNCEAIVDLDTKKVSTTITNKSTGSVIGTVIDNLEATSDELADWPNTVTTFDTFRIATGKVNGVNIDNIVIEQVVAAPTVSASGIEIYDALGELQGVWTAVSPVANTITIDFGTNMDAQTVNTSNIYLIEEGAGSAVSGVVAYSNQAATLTLSSALNADANYILHIDGDVANAAGDTLGDDQEYKITTASGITSAQMGTPTIGGVAVGNFSSIAAGQTITVPVTYMNTTGADKTLRFICAYYGTGLANMKKVEVTSTNVPGSVESGVYEFTHTFKNVEGAAFLRIMIWDGFDTLIPLSSYVNIGN
jgi:hypothetical protein